MSSSRIDASISANMPRSATVSVGRRQFSVGCETIPYDAAALADYALFALAALSMTHDLDIVFDARVSASAVAKVNEIGRLWLLWGSRYARRIYPLRLHAGNVEDAPSPTPAAGVLCMSGGVDSTFAALTRPPELNFRAGLLVAGADYPSLDDPRFTALRDRVTRICEKLELEPVVVWTDLRRLKINYNMFHPLLLAMCMDYIKPAFTHGAYAADYTAAQEFHVHPWGNNSAIAGALSSGTFPIHHLGSEHGRSFKVRALMADNRGLMQAASFCPRNISNAGNCGTCGKCIRTKLNMLTGNADFATFVDKTDPLTLLPMRKLTPKRNARLGVEAFLHDIYFDLPEGEKRVVVGKQLERVREANRPWNFSLNRKLSFQ